MATIPRSSIIRGPAQISYSGQTFYSKDDIKITEAIKTFSIDNSAIGHLDDRADDVGLTIEFTPDGEITSALLLVLFPWITSGILPGTSIFGSTDTPLYIYGRDGIKYTFVNAQVTKMPSLSLSTTKTVMGGITFTCLRSLAGQWSTAGSLWTKASATYPGDAGFNAQNILTTPYTAQWASTLPSAVIASASNASPNVFTSNAHGLVNGDAVVITGALGDLTINGSWYIVGATTNTFELSATSGGSPINTGGTYTANSATFTRNNPFDNFQTDSGFQIDFALSLKPLSTDTDGIIDMTYEKLSASAKCLPVGPQPSDLDALLGAQGAGAVRGGSRQALGRHLYVNNGANFYVKLINAWAEQLSANWGPTTKRLGETTFKTTTAITSGVPQQQIQISTTSIS